MKDTFSAAQLTEWHQNHVQNPALPAITERAFIEIEALEGLVAEMKQIGSKMATVYFIRCKVNGTKPQKTKKLINGVEPIGCTWLEAGNGITQLCIAISPSTNFTTDPVTYETDCDDIPANGSVTLVIPGNREDGPIAMNPPPPKQGTFGGN